MKTYKDLELLSKSIRLTNQAKILKYQYKSIERKISLLREQVAELKQRSDFYIDYAHEIQRQVIPIKIIPFVKPMLETNFVRTKKAAEVTELEGLLSEEEIKRINIFYDNL